MLSIRIQTIPHQHQSYPTVGDWRFYDHENILDIYISNTDDWREEALVALHELVEALLCKYEKIDEKEVTEFDLYYEAHHKAGLSDFQGEPGDHRLSPYQKQHKFATKLEKLFAKKLGVNWKSYEKNLEKLD